MCWFGCIGMCVLRDGAIVRTGVPAVHSCASVCAYARDCAVLCVMLCEHLLSVFIFERLLNADVILKF